MTKEVLLTISGLQFDGDGEDAIEIVSTGTYSFRNGKHYVQYDELLEQEEGSTATVKCMVKISPTTIEVIKKGPAAVHMIFEKDKTHMTYYTTPFGDLMLGITTKSIVLEETKSTLKLQLLYGLDMNYQYVADCKLSIGIVNNE